ncbi:uncharacterized protein HD556DRAFT_1241415 [Suillus plorans]|uniref:Zn(2)-C6 fungal-type domain-containing protein n=1 Tax=Suillus plorans TaxID=116603 RepID=A0A9P7AL23_9AGAM|nr:uncharacterized protein HD556DRAFT_1241415 [Suillus plorans]KAG1790981.1 hypothetical protein HD556DRAFT_1241415 [Suillus plorans]
MSPRASSSAPRTASAASAPYPRRAAGQPKSSRQQFSACGACRMRRVRCDLKDLPMTQTTSGVQHPSCSNCKERGIKCVDEFAEVKAVKLLRRGRRLQQVEAVYGKVTDDESNSSSAMSTPSNPTIPTTLSAGIATSRQSTIPLLKLEFLSSSFFRRFSIQRPIIEPTEFTSRYFAHIKGTSTLSIEGQMIAMLLVTWAASFGVDEYGVEEEAEPHSPTMPDAPKFSQDADDDYSDPNRRARTLRTESMIREILHLIDIHAVLRRPTWDGVRVLLLILPLTQGIQSSMDRGAMYEATLSQVYTLCSSSNHSVLQSGQGSYCDALVRARVFWYAYVHEGVRTALRGGRLYLDEDDLVAFQSTLPPQYCASASGSAPSSTSASSHSSPTATSPVSSDNPVNSLQDPRGHSRASLSYLLSSHYFSLALSVSGVCRAVHAVLTGPRARRRTDAGVAIREDSLVEIWDGLERCWEDFESLRRGAGGIGTVGGGLVRGEDVERFVSGWQVFIFECLNIIREALRQRIVNQTKGSPDSNGRSPPADRALCRMLAQATRRCRLVLPRVIAILKRHLAVPSSGFFAHDAGLIRDGCYYAALLLAQGDVDQDADSDLKGDDGLAWDADAEDGVDVCLRALGEIGWIYANSEEREKTVRMVWEARVIRDDERRRERNRQRDYLEDQRAQAYHSGQRSQDHSPYMINKPSLPASARGQGATPRSLSLVSAAGQSRPHLPPLSVAFSPAESSPNTAITDDGSGSWSTYTPPTTSSSMTSNATTNRSVSPPDSGSPHTLSSLKHLPPIQHSLKTENDSFYNGDLDPFSFSVDGTTGPGVVGGAHGWTSQYQHPVGPGSGYLDPSVIFTGADCQTFYH